MEGNRGSSSSSPSPAPAPKFSGRKRRRDSAAQTSAASADDEDHRSPSHDDSLTLENSLTFSDTSVALRMMCAQFPIIHKVALRPFVLRSQLYSSVKDRTQVDRDLESLKKEKVVRIFKLNSGQDDHAIMFMNDYLRQIETATKRLVVRSEDGTEVFGWFKTYVIDSKLDVSIEHHELCSLLSFGGKVKDEHVSLLINAGLLTLEPVNLNLVEEDVIRLPSKRHSEEDVANKARYSNRTRQLIDSNVYWFAIPNIGSILKGLSQGRKELLSFMERRKFKEIPLAQLEKKRLRLSPLDMQFHIRDLIGAGHLKTHHTPIGLVVRISRD